MKTNSSCLSNYRTVLLAKREELIERIYACRSETVAHKQYRTDISLQAVVRDLAYMSMENEIRTLAEVELSLRRLETGEYGVCGSCSANISPARLKAIPWTRVCVVCAGGGVAKSSPPKDSQALHKTTELPKNVVQFRRTPPEFYDDDPLN